MAQPNFMILNNSVAAFSNELSNFQNLPQVVDGPAIMNAINELRDAVLAMQNGLQARMRASTQNNIARNQNSTRCMDTSALVPLVHAVTGNAIDGFPATLGALNNLPDAHIRAILNALEQPEAGTVVECRTRLLTTIGVVMRTV